MGTKYCDGANNGDALTRKPKTRAAHELSVGISLGSGELSLPHRISDCVDKSMKLICTLSVVVKGMPAREGNQSCVAAALRKVIMLRRQAQVADSCIEAGIDIDNWIASVKQCIEYIIHQKPASSLSTTPDLAPTDS